MKKKAPVTDAQPTSGLPTHDQVAQRAYEFFLARGATPGHDVEDWLRAEDELRTAGQRDATGAAGRPAARVIKERKAALRSAVHE